MRIGINPAKLNSKIEQKYYHRIIIPVFVPDFTGYFKDIFEVYKTCIVSAYLTQHKRTAITVIDNGSCELVRKWLQEKTEEGVIETLISHKENIGKVDAIVGAARGCREELITISDSDILFHEGWQEAVEKVFSNFPNVGSVAPFPIARHLYYYSTSVLKEIVKRNLKFNFEKSKNTQGIEAVYDSYGWTFDESYDGFIPVVYNGAHKAVVGSGHQVMTIRRGVFFNMPYEPCYIKISSGSEAFWIDAPIDAHGYLRLSTVDTLVSHMGNVLTDQNRDDLKSLQLNESTPPILSLPSLKAVRSSMLNRRIYTKLFKKLYDHRGPAPFLKINIQQDG